MPRIRSCNDYFVPFLCILARSSNLLCVQLTSPISTSLEKQCGHGVICFCSLSGMLCVNWKTFHRDAIISS